MRNEEHTAPPLGYSEVPSVQHSPGEPVPEFRQPPEEGAKCPSSVRGQDAGDVLPDDPPRPQSSSQLQIDEGELASRIIEAFAESCD